jgi:hypothetical protein
MTVPARDRHGGAQGWLGHESGYLRVKFTYPLGKKFPVSGINRACKSILCPGLWVYLEEHPMEVWVSGSKLYTVVLADTEFQEVGERKRAKEKEEASGVRSEAFLGLLVAGVKKLSILFLTALISFSIVMLTRRNVAASFAPPA